MMFDFESSHLLTVGARAVEPNQTVCTPDYCGGINPGGVK
jgi:hypothetical protein